MSLYNLKAELLYVLQGRIWKGVEVVLSSLSTLTPSTWTYPPGSLEFPNARLVIP